MLQGFYSSNLTRDEMATIKSVASQAKCEWYTLLEFGTSSCVVLFHVPMKDKQTKNVVAPVAQELKRLGVVSSFRCEEQPEECCLIHTFLDDEGCEEIPARPKHPVVYSTNDATTFECVVPLMFACHTIGDMIEVVEAARTFELPAIVYSFEHLIDVHGAIMLCVVVSTTLTHEGLWSKFHAHLAACFPLSSTTTDYAFFD